VAQQIGVGLGVALLHRALVLARWAVAFAKRLRHDSIRVAVPGRWLQAECKFYGIGAFGIWLFGAEMPEKLS
jgi:hypothetical protein